MRELDHREHDVDGPEEGIPGFSPPRSRRTQDALRRIVAATHELLVERGPSGTSLIEVAAAADVSTSSLYGRFRAKSALLDYAHARYSRDNHARILDFLEELEARSPDIRTMADELFLFGISNAKATGPLTHAFRRAGQQVPSILNRENRAEADAARRVERTVVRLWDAELDGATRTRIRDTVRVFLSMLREGGDVPGLTALFPDCSDEAVARRLATLALQSIGYGGPSRSGGNRTWS